MTNNSIKESSEPELCKKCDGIGSIWIYNKEKTCLNCNGNGVEPATKAYRYLDI